MCNSPGLILNIGKYLTEQDISENVLAYCAQKDFALFTIPWHIRFADIVQDYGKCLLLAQQNQLNFEMLMHGVISSSCQKDDYLQALNGGMYPHTAFRLKLYESLLVPLLRYDEQHNAQLAPTLRYYLFHMNSLQETARAMYAHRNTVSYRINKIKEITGADFDDAVVCFDYMLAYYVGDYFKMKDIVEKRE